MIQEERYIDTTSKLYFIQQIQLLNRIICAKGIQVILSASKPDQLDTKAFLLHKAVILHIRTDGATRTRSVISQVTFAFLKWIILDKRPPASPQKESSRISDCQQPLGHASAAPVCSSCLKVKLQLEKQEEISWFLSSSHKIGEHSSLQCKLKQVSS